VTWTVATQLRHWTFPTESHHNLPPVDDTMDEDQAPSQIVPERAPRRTIGDRLNIVKKTFFTREGLLGTYDYAFLFRPNLPFMKKSTKAPPFFGLNDRMPVVLALLLGFQHALAMVRAVLTKYAHR